MMTRPTLTWYEEYKEMLESRDMWRFYAKFWQIWAWVMLLALCGLGGIMLTLI